MEGYWEKKNSCMSIHYFRSFTNITVPAGVSLRGESPGLRPHSRQRGAQSHSGGEAPERLPGNDSAAIQQVFFLHSRRHIRELFVNKHTGRHPGVRMCAGHRGPVGGGGGVRGAGRNGLVLPHYLQTAPGQEVSPHVRTRQGTTFCFTLTASIEKQKHVCGFSIYGRGRKYEIHFFLLRL